MRGDSMLRLITMAEGKKKKKTKKGQFPDFNPTRGQLSVSNAVGIMAEEKYAQDIEGNVRSMFSPSILGLGLCDSLLRKAHSISIMTPFSPRAKKR